VVGGDVGGDSDEPDIDPDEAPPPEVGSPDPDNGLVGWETVRWDDDPGIVFSATSDSRPAAATAPATIQRVPVWMRRNPASRSRRTDTTSSMEDAPECPLSARIGFACEHSP
jgi:hypothetical protein